MIDLTIEELSLVKQALEESLGDWTSQERGLQNAKILFPDDWHLLYCEDELPSEALDLAEMLLIKINDELILREKGGETVWWKQNEIVNRNKDHRLIRRRN